MHLSTLYRIIGNMQVYFITKIVSLGKIRSLQLRMCISKKSSCANDATIIIDYCIAAM